MSLTFYFNSKEEPQRPEDDQLPDEITKEEFQERYAKIVYCDYEDFSKLIQSDGTPYGGSMESQNKNVDMGFEGYI